MRLETDYELAAILRSIAPAVEAISGSTGAQILVYAIRSRNHDLVGGAMLAPKHIESRKNLFKAILSTAIDSTNECEVDK